MEERHLKGSVEKEYVLPKDVIYICFTDYSFEKRGESENLYNSFLEVYFEKENFFFYPVGSGEGLDSKEMKHINLEKITENENPFCIENINGKITNLSNESERINIEKLKVLFFQYKSKSTDVSKNNIKVFIAPSGPLNFSFNSSISNTSTLANVTGFLAIV